MTAGASTDTARSAGRGGLAILGAKIYFMLIGLVQQIALKAILGLSGYGAYSTAQGVASITYNPIVQASIQGASREISAAPEELRPGLTRHLLLLHTRGALALAGLFFLLAHPTARVLGAPHVGRTLQILSVVVLMYGVYAPLIGVLNGLRRFLPQALLDVAAATLRTLGLLAGAYAATRLLQPGDMVAVEGANVGFALASLLILGCALVITGWGKPAGRPLVAREYATFVLPVLGGQVLQNLLFQADSLLLRKFASEAALAAGLDGAAADPFVGAYRAAQLFCFLPYQLLMSVTFVLFPLLASAQARGDEAQVKSYVLAGMRLALLASTLMVSVLVALPGGLIGLVYGADAALLGSGAMRVLAVGLGSFALIGVMTSALNSLGRTGLSFGVTGLATALVTALCFTLARGHALSPELLVRTATATTSALLLTSVLTGVVLYLVSGACFLPLGMLRILGSGVVSAAATSALVTQGSGHAGPGATLGGAALCVTCFLGLLVITRELGRDDWLRLRALVGRAP